MRNKGYRRIIVVLCCVLLLMLGTSCNASSKDSQNSVKEADVKMKMSAKPVVDDFKGFGAQTDFYFTLRKNTQRGVTAADRKLITNRMKDMHLAVGRVLFSYNWWEPTEGVRGKESPEWLDFLESLTMMKKAGVSVNICPWGDYFGYASWQNVEKGQRSPQGEALEKTAQSITSMLYYLIEDKKFTNIKYFTLVNEPSNQSTDNPYDPDLYMKLSRRIDALLKEKGIRNKITFVGCDASDWGEPVDDWFLQTFNNDTTRIFDAYTIHSYAYNIDSVDNAGLWIQNREDMLKQLKKKTDLFVGEFGMYGENNGTYRQPKTLTYDYGLFINDFCIHCINKGAAQMLYWNLTDTYVTLNNDPKSPDDDNFRTSYGLWEYKDKNWKAKPGFYAYSMLTSKTSPGDKVYALTSDHINVCGTVFSGKNGKTTIALVNDCYDDFEVKIELADAVCQDTLFPHTLKSYVYSENSLPDNDKKIASSAKIKVKKSVINILVPARSSLVLSDR